MKRTVLFAIIIAFVVVGSLATILLVRMQGAQNCTSVERYDLLTDECYFECDTDQECAALSQQVNDELNQSFAQTQTKTAASKPLSSQALEQGSLYDAQSTGSETGGNIYTVTPEGLVPRPTQQDEAIWALTVKLIGTKVASERLLSFEIFDDTNSDTAAAVWRSDNPAKWHMSVNAALGPEGRKDLMRTIVHEYAHILTLSDNQVGEVRGSCPRLEMSEGCANDSSYIQRFYDRFWKAYGLTQNESGELSEPAAARLLESRPDSFVSDYASTNIAEDIAESFTEFVFSAKPTGSNEKDQKVRFFYDYPELILLREQIRAAAASVVL